MFTVAAIHRLRNNSRGTTVIEFAIVAPVFFALVVGGLYACIGVFTATSLHYAVEQAARCYSISTANSTGSCTSSSTTQTYASGVYKGPVAPAPTFTATTPSCGHQVTGTVSFVFNYGVSHSTVPINASACFP